MDRLLPNRILAHRGWRITDGLSTSSLGMPRVEQAFRDACSLGNREELKEIAGYLTVDKLDEILSNSQNYPTGTPLFEAVLCEQVNIVEDLIHLGCDLEQECSLDIFFPIQFVDTGPALCVACTTGNLRCVTLLLEAGASVNHSGRSSTPLMAACENGNTELINKMLESGAQVNMSAGCEDGRTPLHVTCTYHDNVENVRLLLAYGADVNSLDKHGRSPLYYACLGGHCNVSELLLQHGDLASSAEDQNKMLWLLGAECLVRLDDKMAAIKYWKWSFSSDLSYATYKDLVAKTLSEAQRSCALCQELCTTDDISRLLNNSACLKMQALIFLYLVLGWGTETISFLTSQITSSLSRKQTWESCQLLAFSEDMPQSVTSKDLASACDNMSQIIEELLDVILDEHNSQEFVAMETILLAILNQILQLLEKTISSLTVQNQKILRLMSRQGHSSESRSSKDTCVQLAEAFIGVFSITGKCSQTSDTRQKFNDKLSQFRLLCQLPKCAELKLNCAVWMIAVHGGPCCKYSLTWHHEKLFPCPEIVKLLAECGFDVSCVDYLGNTPLHNCLICEFPDADVFHTLLDCGSEIDIPNKMGVRPCDADIVSKNPAFMVSVVKYRSLRSLAAEAIVKHKIAYATTLPDTLVSFVQVRDYKTPTYYT